ncbi:MAG TPA: hemerythrin domain-containing protein [Actinomycetes bacterium]|nr:hemerythrin domain-containing protein [Actinomycetes bacterium]
MSEATKDRKQSERFADEDILGILFEQHAEIHELVTQIQESSGDDRRLAFERFKRLITAHEAAEQKVLRPVTRDIASDVAEARLEEEQEAREVLEELSELDIASVNFETEFRKFSQAVNEHAEAEEKGEFLKVETARDESQRRILGSEFLAAFDAAEGNR